MQNEEELKQILAGLQQQQRPTPIWQRIIESVARGIGVAGSPNPGGALINQIEEMGAERRRKEDREQSIRNLGVQFKLQDLAARMSEGRKIEEENRANTRQIESEARSEDRAIRQFARESGFQEKMSDKQFEQTKRLAAIKQGYDVDIATLNNKFAIDIENKRSSNNVLEQKIGRQLSVIVPLLYSGMVPQDVAQGIIDKMEKGEKLTAAENGALGRAEKALRDQKYKEELKQRYASNNNTQESMTFKLNQWALGQARATDLGMDEKGGIHEITTNPLTMRKEGPPGTKIVKFLNEDEQVDYYREQAKIKEFASNEQKNFLIGKDSGNVDFFLQQIQMGRQAGYSDDNIKQNMLNAAQKNPMWKDAINMALQKDEVDRAKNKVDAAEKERADVEEQLKYAGPKERPGLEKKKAEIEAKGKPAQDVRKLEKIVDDFKKQIDNYSGTYDPELNMLVDNLRAKLEDAKERLDYARKQLK